MKQLTIEQQLENVKLAERIWKERVDPAAVVKGLEDWACGTQACFGGHLATWPEFRKMGVRMLVEINPTEIGSWRFCPAFDRDTYGLSVVPLALFGDEALFHPRGDHPADPSYDPTGNYQGVDDETVSDHQLVLNRLAYARWQLEKQL